MNAPCYKCDERRKGCHAVCERYLQYAAKLRDINNAERVAVDADAHIREYIDKKRRRRNT